MLLLRKPQFLLKYNTMAFQQTSDLLLPNLICSNTKVVVKFIADDCPVCKELEPTYQQLSALKRYQDIIFLKMDAKENPVISRQVKQGGNTPFIATYRNGVLKNYKLVTGENDIVSMLDELVN